MKKWRTRGNLNEETLKKVDMEPYEGSFGFYFRCDSLE